jgi:hypothetical protein
MLKSLGTFKFKKGLIFKLFESGSNDLVSLDDLLRIFEEMTKFKTNSEKLYLLGIFFPEKLFGRNIHQINPFPYSNI